MLLNILFDLIILAIIFIFAVYGYRKGALFITANSLKRFFCFLLSLRFSVPVAEVFIVPLINGSIVNSITRRLTETSCVNSDLNKEIPFLLRVIAMSQGFDASDFQYATCDEIQQFVFAVAFPIVLFISSVIAFFALKFLLNRLLSIIIRVASSLFQKGIVGKLNKILGLLLSCSFALIVAFGFTLILDFIINSDGLKDFKIVKEFSGGPIYNLFMLFSPLSLLLSF